MDGARANATRRPATHGTHGTPAPRREVEGRPRGIGVIGAYSSLL
jgi:hypothetical protein